MPPDEPDKKDTPIVPKGSYSQPRAIDPADPPVDPPAAPLVHLGTKETVSQPINEPPSSPDVSALLQNMRAIDAIRKTPQFQNMPQTTPEGIADFLKQDEERAKHAEGFYKVSPILAPKLVRGVVQGPAMAADSIATFATQIGGSDYKLTESGYWNPQSMGHPDTIYEALAQGVSQFLTVYLLGGRVLGLHKSAAEQLTKEQIKRLKRSPAKQAHFNARGYLRGLGRGVVVGEAAAFFAFDPAHGNLSTFINDLGKQYQRDNVEFGKTLTHLGSLLAKSDDFDDTKFNDVLEGKFKNGLEGAGLTPFANTIIRVIRHTAYVERSMRSLRRLEIMERELGGKGPEAITDAFKVKFGAELKHLATLEHNAFMADIAITSEMSKYFSGDYLIAHRHPLRGTPKGVAEGKPVDADHLEFKGKDLIDTDEGHAQALEERLRKNNIDAEYIENTDPNAPLVQLQGDKIVVNRNAMAASWEEIKLAGDPRFRSQAEYYSFLIEREVVRKTEFGGKGAATEGTPPSSTLVDAATEASILKEEGGIRWDGFVEELAIAVEQAHADVKAANKNIGTIGGKWIEHELKMLGKEGSSTLSTHPAFKGMTDVQWRELLTSEGSARKIQKIVDDYSVEAQQRLDDAIAREKDPVAFETKKEAEAAAAEGDEFKVDIEKEIDEIAHRNVTERDRGGKTEEILGDTKIIDQATHEADGTFWSVDGESIILDIAAITKDFERGELRFFRGADGTDASHQEHLIMESLDINFEGLRELFEKTGGAQSVTKFLALRAKLLLNELPKYGGNQLPSLGSKEGLELMMKLTREALLDKNVGMGFTESRIAREGELTVKVDPKPLSMSMDEMFKEGGFEQFTINLEKGAPFTEAVRIVRENNLFNENTLFGPNVDSNRALAALVQLWEHNLPKMKFESDRTALRKALAMKEDIKAGREPRSAKDLSREMAMQNLKEIEELARDLGIDPALLEMQLRQGSGYFEGIFGPMDSVTAKHPLLDGDVSTMHTRILAYRLLQEEQMGQILKLSQELKLQLKTGELKLETAVEFVTLVERQKENIVALAKARRAWGLQGRSLQQIQALKQGDGSSVLGEDAITQMKAYLIDAHGGNSEIAKAATLIVEAAEKGGDNASLSARHAMGAMVNTGLYHNFMQIHNDMLINALLSGVKTQVVNNTSNILRSYMDALNPSIAGYGADLPHLFGGFFFRGRNLRLVKKTFLKKHGETKAPTPEHPEGQYVQDPRDWVNPDTKKMYTEEEAMAKIQLWQKTNGAELLAGVHDMWGQFFKHLSFEKWEPSGPINAKRRFPIDATDTDRMMRQSWLSGQKLSSTLEHGSDPSVSKGSVGMLQEHTAGGAGPMETIWRALKGRPDQWRNKYMAWFEGHLAPDDTSWLPFYAHGIDTLYKAGVRIPMRALIVGDEWAKQSFFRANTRAKITADQIALAGHDPTKIRQLSTLIDELTASMYLKSGEYFNVDGLWREAEAHVNSNRRQMTPEERATQVENYFNEEWNRVVHGYNGQARAEFAKGMLKKAREVTWQERPLDTFRENVEAGDVHPDANYGRQLDWLSRKFGKSPLGTAVQPFILVPGNLFKFVGQTSMPFDFPQGLRLGHRKLHADLASNDFGRHADAQGRMVMGMALWAAGIGLAKAGYTTGAGPTNWAERRQYEQVNQRWSIRTPVGQVAYNRLDPWAAYFAIPAAINEGWNRARSKREKDHYTQMALATTLALTQATFDRSYLKNISAAIDAATHSEKDFGHWVRQYWGSHNPTIAKDISKVFDDQMRETRTYINALNVRAMGVPLVYEEIGPDGKEIKWGRLYGPPIRNILGEATYKNTNNLYRAAASWWLPTSIKPDAKDIVMDELVELMSSLDRPKAEFNGVPILDMTMYRTRLDKKKKDGTPFYTQKQLAQARAAGIHNSQDLYDFWEETTSKLRLDGSALLIGADHPLNLARDKDGKPLALKGLTLRKALTQLIQSKAYQKLPTDNNPDEGIESHRLELISQLINVYRSKAWSIIEGRPMYKTSIDKNGTTITEVTGHSGLIGTFWPAFIVRRIINDKLNDDNKNLMNARDQQRNMQDIPLGELERLLEPRRKEKEE